MSASVRVSWAISPLMYDKFEIIFLRWYCPSVEHQAGNMGGPMSNIYNPATKPTQILAQNNQKYIPSMVFLKPDLRVSHLYIERHSWQRQQPEIWKVNYMILNCRKFCFRKSEKDTSAIKYLQYFLVSCTSPI